MPASLKLPDRYRLEGPLAAGGMASVYAAHDTLLDRPVAVKVLAEHLGTDAAARQRFAREARAAAGLSSHPAVVTIFDVGEYDGRSFIVMELLRGGTVAQVLRRDRRVEPERALRWLRGVAGALDRAHERGIVHRDIKPANLLLDEQDHVAVADFGIARLAWEDQVTATGQVLGTAAYISPEQAEGAPATAASDRYSLAVLAFELLTGERPFSGEHFAAQARAHIEDPPPLASERCTALPRVVDGVLARGLAKDPAARWPTATAFVDALQTALDGTLEETASTQVMAPLAARAAAGVPPLPPERSRPAPALAPRPRRRSQRSLALAAAPLLLGLLAIAAVAAIVGGDDSGREPAGTPERAERRATPTPTAAKETPAPTPTPDAPASGDPGALNARGFELFKSGDYAAAVPLFTQAVEACGDGGQLDPCGYALYNLGASLRRSGQPQAAIPVLETRLRRFGDNEQGHVAQELDAAYEDAGLDQPGAKPGKGKGKGRDKNRRGDDD